MVTFLSLLAGLAIVFLLNLISSGGTNISHDMDMDAIADDEEMSEENLRVLTILKASYKAINLQRGGGYGPWIPALIEKGETNPAIALTAIQWTIRDILSAPISYDKDGREMPRRKVNLDGLYKAEDDLMRIMGEGE